MLGQTTGKAAHVGPEARVAGVIGLEAFAALGSCEASRHVSNASIDNWGFLRLQVAA